MGRWQAVHEDLKARGAARFLVWMGLVAVAHILTFTTLQLKQGLLALQLTWAVELACLLLTPRRQWLAYVAGFIATLSLIRASGLTPLTFNPLGVSSVICFSLFSLLGAFLLAGDRGWIEGKSDRVMSWLRFAVVAGLLLPALGAAMFAIAAPSFAGRTQMEIAVHVFAANSLGYLVLTPIVLRLRPGQLMGLWRGGRGLEAVAAILGFGLLAALIFRQPAVLPLFLIPLPLIAMLFRLGFVGAAGGLGLLLPIAALATAADTGPFATIAAGSLYDAVLTCFGFLILTFVIVVLVASLLYERETLQDLSEADRDIYELIARQSGDMAFVTDEDGRTVFVSPAATTALGLADHRAGDFDWKAQTHPDDLPQVEAALDGIRTGMGDAEYVFRARHADGSYRWFESHVRMARGARRLIVGTVRDVTARVMRERQLEEMAGVDALTGLPNRRQLDERRRLMWRQSARRGAVLSMLVIDVDNFKAYNDLYGHGEGDRCLRLVAAALRQSLTRPEDFCARYGGEEFVALLSDTGADKALAIAGDICLAVRRQNVPHRGSDHGAITVSIGCASFKPSFAEDDGSLFAAADSALYQAKRQGRNRVVATNLHEAPGALREIEAAARLGLLSAAAREAPTGRRGSVGGPSTQVRS